MALEMLKILLSGFWTLLDPFTEFIQVCIKYYESLRKCRKSNSHKQWDHLSGP